MKEVSTPEVTMDRGGAIAFATEIAFNNLLASAKKNGVAVSPVMGFEYLPEPALKEEFRSVCRRIIDSLKMPE